MGLIGFERRTIAALSGGQMQRALFARLLLQDSQLIVFDEAFNAVNGKTMADLIEVIAGMAKAEPSLLRFTISTSCACMSRRRCSLPASLWPGAKRPACSTRTI